MRIITGRFRGKEISPPSEGIGLRPTSDKVREAIFDTIRNYIEGALFLDLYAGSGAMGMEAISEGARSVVFVEKSPYSLRVLRKNVSDFGIKNETLIVKKDVLLLLKSPQKLFERMNSPFDFIFLDPPFPLRLAGKTVQLLADSPFIYGNTFIVAEHVDEEVLPDEVGGLHSLEKFKEKYYGKVVVSYYRSKAISPSF